MRQLDWSEPLATWLVRHSANCLSRSATHRKSVGGVKLLNLEKKQRFYWSSHVVNVEWQVMRRE